MKKLILLLTITLLAITAFADSWTQKADFGGGKRATSVCFSISNYGYIGLGTDSSFHNYNDIWEYDPILNTWTQKADFPGNYNETLNVFSINNLGYLINPLSGSIDSMQVWEFNPISNFWTQKNNFPGLFRYAGSAFSIGNKGYFGTGRETTGNYLKDFWGYDPSIDIWTQLADVGDTAREAGVTFSIGNKGYIGGGQNDLYLVYFHNLWEYDTLLNTWSRKANCPTTFDFEDVSLSIMNKGYFKVHDDMYTHFWEYDPTTDTWTQKASFAGYHRFFIAGFSIGSKGYLGTGADESETTFYKDFWEYTPDSLTTGINELTNPIQTTLYPNPFSTQTTLTIRNYELGIRNGEIKIYDVDGQEVKTIPINNQSQITINRNGMANGVYFIEVKIGEETIVKKVVVED